MKTFYCLALTLLLGMFTNAQAQTRFGIQGSLQFANISSSGNGVSFTGDNLLGFRGGVLADLPISGQISLRPQLLYSTKGTDFSKVTGTPLKTGIQYLEVPVQLMYSLNAGPGHVVLGAGPYVGYALSSTTNGTSDASLDGLNRLDVGLALSAGYELESGLIFSGYFSPGLTNLIADSAQLGGATSRNTAFGLNVGYIFGAR